jgi:hypothetical protein
MDKMPPLITDPRPIAEIEADVIERAGDPNDRQRNPLGWAPLCRDKDGVAIMATRVLNGPIIDGVPHTRRGFKRITKQGILHDVIETPVDA